MKKVFSLALSVLLLLSSVTGTFFFPATAADAESDYQYTIKNGGAVILRYDGISQSDKGILIPRTLGGYPVKEIGTQAFFYCPASSISIPNTVEVIGDSAFYGCFFSNIQLPNNLKQIDDYAFYLCDNLESVTIPHGVTTIGEYAFSSCSDLTSVSISRSVTTIGNNAFSDCHSLTTVNTHGDASAYSASDLFYHTNASLIIYYDPETSGWSTPVWNGYRAYPYGTQFYHVTVINGSGQDTYTAGSTVSIQANNPPAGFVFDKWISSDGVTFDQESSPVTTFIMPTKNVTVEATYKKIQTPPEDTYTVIFKDWDGTVLKVQTDLPFGACATPPPAPSREGYTFTGWDTGGLDFVVCNLTVTATYQVKEYQVVFCDEDGLHYSMQIIEHGKAATPPPDPSREGYTFTGWDKDFSNVTSNLTIKPLWKIHTFTVTFQDWDGTILQVQTDVPYGTSVTPPPDPSRTGYSFTGWDVSDGEGDFAFLRDNLTLVANYHIRFYEIHIIEGEGGGITGVQDGERLEQYGTNVTLIAWPFSGYKFEGWYENGVKIEDAQEEYAFLVTKDTTLEARFVFDQSFLSDGEVRIQADAGIIPVDAVFEVSKKMPPPQEIVEKVEEQYGSAATIISHYEITLKDFDNNPITKLDGDLTISIKLPFEYENSKNLIVVQEDEEGNLIKLKSWIENGYICYKTNWL